MVKRNILIFSSGQTEAHASFYHYCHDWLQTFLSKNLPPNPKIIYIAWGLWGGHDADKVFYWGQRHFQKFGLTLTTLHTQPDYFSAIQSADAIIVEGGSIHLLVRDLELNSLMIPIKDKLNSGCLYIGMSSGGIITSPTMHTATESPLIHIPSHKTLNVLPFQISPHYRDVPPDQFHEGPTPEQRIRNYLLLNPDPKPVLCLTDGSYIHVSNNKLSTFGKETYILDRKPSKHLIPPNSDLSSLLDYRSKYYKTH